MAQGSDVELRLVGHASQRGAVETLADDDPEQRVDDLLTAGVRVHVLGHGAVLSRVC
ncbi:hypothetical protein GCM10020254_16330 [Streptomyces goshikiensis]